MSHQTFNEWLVQSPVGVVSLGVVATFISLAIIKGGGALIRYIEPQKQLTNFLWVRIGIARVLAAKYRRNNDRLSEGILCMWYSSAFLFTSFCLCFGAPPLIIGFMLNGIQIYSIILAGVGLALLFVWFEIACGFLGLAAFILEDASTVKKQLKNFKFSQETTVGEVLDYLETNTQKLPKS